MEIDLEKVSMTGTARERVIKIIETIPDGKAWPITDVAEKAGTEAEYTRRICSEIGVDRTARAGQDKIGHGIGGNMICCRDLNV